PPSRRPSMPPLFPYTTLFRSQGRPSFRSSALQRGFCPVGEAQRAEWLAGGQSGDAAVHRPSGTQQEVQVAASGRRLRESGSLSKDRKSTRLNSSHVSISYAVF